MDRLVYVAMTGANQTQLAQAVNNHNLANVSTTGFKAGRVEFQTLLSQTISFGTAPQGFLGGIRQPSLRGSRRTDQ